MIIRCPDCEFSRSIGEHSIPNGAEFVTCPKCKHRFRFRTIERAEEFAVTLEKSSPQLSTPPQPSTDIWDAVDALHQRFERQLESQVTEVEQIYPSLESQDHSSKTNTGHLEAYLVSKQEDHLEANLAPKQDQAFSNEQLIKDKTLFSSLSRLFRSLPFFTSTTSKKEAFPEKNFLLEDDQAESQKGEIKKELPELLKSTQPSVDHTKEREKKGGTENSATCSKKDDAVPEKMLPYSTDSAPSNNFATHPTLFADKVNSPYLDRNETPLVAEIQRSHCNGEDTPMAQRSNASLLQEASVKPLAVQETADKPLLKAIQEAADKPLQADIQASDAAKFKPIFPFLNEDTTPEQHVEQGLTYLKADQDRPLRNLGKIEDIQIDQEPCFGAPIGNVKWESPAQHGWWKSFVHTVMSVMFSAPSFFLKLPSSSGLSLAFTFFLIQSYFVILFSLLWGYITGQLLDIPVFQTTIANLPFMLLLAPIALGLIVILSTELLRIALIFFGTKNVPFPLILRIICYSTAPMVLSIIPFIGPFVGALWFFLSMVIAGKKIFSSSWISALLFTLPATLSIICGVLLFFL